MTKYKDDMKDRNSHIFHIKLPFYWGIDLYERCD